MSLIQRLRGRTRAWVGAALVTSGLAAGAVLGSTMTAGASTNSASTAAGSTASNTYGSSSGSGSSGPASSGTAYPPAGYRGLPDSGTVTAIGSDSVTIDGKTYAVTSSSDIDKNGEATLSSLAVGDTVTFDTVPSASTPTIDKLHAGSEALDRPSGPPGAPAAGSGTSGGTGSTSTIG